MKKHNEEPKKNITMPAVIFLGLMAVYYYAFSNSTIKNIDYSNTDNYENYDTYKTYTWTLHENQILDIELNTTDNYIINGDSIYQGNTKLCSFSASHISNYKQAYKGAVEDGIIENGYLSGGEYVVSSYPTYRGTTYYYLISLDNFYYTVTLSSDTSLEALRECYNRVSFKIAKTA